MYAYWSTLFFYFKNKLDEKISVRWRRQAYFITGTCYMLKLVLCETGYLHFVQRFLVSFDVIGVLIVLSYNTRWDVIFYDKITFFVSVIQEKTERSVNISHIFPSTYYNLSIQVCSLFRANSGFSFGFVYSSSKRIITIFQSNLTFCPMLSLSIFCSTLNTCIISLEFIHQYYILSLSFLKGIIWNKWKNVSL